MKIETVIYQSTLDGATPYQQLSNLVLEGLSTKDDTLNTDNGKLYGSFTKNEEETLAFNLYKDIAKTELVASVESVEFGVKELEEENDSGITGTVNLARYLADDNSIEVLCFLSKDRDLPMNNLEGLSDYDDEVGFATFHLLAFNYIKEFVISRNKTTILNRDYITTTQINGGIGGYDLSRCINLHSLREASAEYAFSRIAEKQYCENGSVWDVRQKEAKNKLRAHLEATDLVFDLNQDRVEDKSRPGMVWKIKRA